MKRILYSIPIFFTALTLSACGKTGQEMPLSENINAADMENIDATETENIEMMKTSENDNMFNGSKEAIENENSILNRPKFDFETKTVILNSGYEMPIYGLGTYSLTGEKCVYSVTAALPVPRLHRGAGRRTRRAGTLVFIQQRVHHTGAYRVHRPGISCFGIKEGKP